MIFQVEQVDILVRQRDEDRKMIDSLVSENSEMKTEMEMMKFHLKDMDSQLGVYGDSIKGNHS